MEEEQHEGADLRPKFLYVKCLFTPSILFPIYCFLPNEFLILGNINFYKIEFISWKSFFFIKWELVIFEKY